MLNKIIKPECLFVLLIWAYVITTGSVLMLVMVEELHAGSVIDSGVFQAIEREAE
jgi:hypothetical protein